jgi:energy-converting hydrogenase Eha subunit A
MVSAATGVLALLVLGAFFLPWTSSAFLTMVEDDSGLDLARTAQSAASGYDLSILFLTPVAALGILVLSFKAVRRALGATLASLFQLVLVAAALFPLATTLPAEIDTWTVDSSYEYGLWITVASLVVIGIVTLIDLLTAITERAGAART